VGISSSTRGKLMSSRFLQGDGFPILYRFNSLNILQETVNLPYVRDDGSKSYIKQFFDLYPEVKMLHHDLLSGNISEDKPMGYKIRVEIKYSSIPAANLLSIYTCILNCLKNSGDYLRLLPRNDHNTGLYKTFDVIYKGNLAIESSNMWQHNVILNFNGTALISTSFIPVIPPVI
jgi:hypothetical protein